MISRNVQKDRRPVGRTNTELHHSRIIPEVQAMTGGWLPPGGVLGRIVHETGARVAAIAIRAEELRAEVVAGPAPQPFAAALRTRHVAVIAEVKRRSPSKGEIAPELDAADRAAEYAEGGAAAISVLTEPERFGGSLDDLRRARARVGIPLLAKDFHIDPLQLLAARAAGASAALLIVRALSPGALSLLSSSAREAGLEILFEVRSERELERALEAGAEVIGVNSRDLETLEVDPTVCDRLIPFIPRECVAVFESGIRTEDDVRRAAELGADAVLVGSVLSSSTDPATAVRALAAVPRVGRDR